MSKRTEQEINDIAKKMILRVLDMKPGERAAVVGLVEEIEPSILDEDSSIMPGGLMFDITDAFFELALDEDDLLLDMSEHDLKKEGLPFILNFIVRRRIAGKHLNVDELLDMLDWFHFAIGGYPQGFTEITFRKDHEGEWVCLDERWGQSSFNETCRIEINVVETARKLIKDVGVLGWDETYWSPILDGIQWELELRFSDGTFFESYGSNNCPTGFNTLIEGLIALGLNTEVFDYEQAWA